MTSGLRKITISALVAMGLLVWVQTSTVSGSDLPASTWNPPLDAPVRLINQYRQPNSDFSAGHRGVDYLVTKNQAVLAPADGQVWFAGKVAARPLLSLLHDGVYLTEFEPVCTDLKKGDQVYAGQEIARVCKAEASYLQHCPNAVCLHFSMRFAGSYLSPLIFIGGLNPSRLLPMLADERFYNRP
jgi:murein DD-endopeptidase MepM/ murein hydrolase activator NlpD